MVPASPTDEYLFTHGTIITLVNNAVNEYRITLDNLDYYYYCKTYSYDTVEVLEGEAVLILEVVE